MMTNIYIYICISKLITKKGQTKIKCYLITYDDKHCGTVKWLIKFFSFFNIIEVAKFVFISRMGILVENMHKFGYHWCTYKYCYKSFNHTIFKLSINHFQMV